MTFLAHRRPAEGTGREGAIAESPDDVQHRETFVLEPDDLVDLRRARPRTPNSIVLIVAAGAAQTTGGEDSRRASRTSVSCSAGLTLRSTCATTPSGPITKVVRSLPKYVLPYIDFSAQTP